jgi:ribosome biogenesis GTPase
VRGRIQKALSGFYYVDTGEALVTCRARGKFRREGISPLVGDWVEFQDAGNGEGLVTVVEPRTNSFTRPAVANIDQLVVFASGAIPVTDPFLIDRISTIAVLKRCQVLVCINKDDLDPGDALYEIYASSGIPVLRLSALTGDGMEALRTALSGKLSAFTGNSGVGKSSVLNALAPSLCLPTNEVSHALGRGKHTTRHVELYPLGGGTAVIDTPGFSSFDTEELDLQLKENLPRTFPEFIPYLEDCRYMGCSHVREKGCAVLAAVAAGKIQKSRHDSYVRLFEELKGVQAWQKKQK